MPPGRIPRAPMRNRYTDPRPNSRRAPALPQVEPTEDSTSSLIDVDSPHVSSVPSDFESQSVKTKTQAERLEHEAEDREQELEHKAKDKFDEISEEAPKTYEKGKKKSAEKGKQAKEQVKEKSKEASDKTKEASEEFRENSDNPVVVANLAVIGLGSALLGWGAYQKYSVGELSWKVVGAWMGVVGLFAAGDYYLSQYLFKNKYPKK